MLKLFNEYLQKELNYDANSRGNILALIFVADRSMKYEVHGSTRIWSENMSLLSGSVKYLQAKFRVWRRQKELDMTFSFSLSYAI